MTTKYIFKTPPSAAHRSAKAMTDTDELVFAAIRAYRKEYGRYPDRVEVTNRVRQHMELDAFYFPNPPTSEEMIARMEAGAGAPGTSITRVPVTPVGDYVMANNDEKQLAWVAPD
jgi:hypothetical protein